MDQEAPDSFQEKLDLLVRLKSLARLKGLMESGMLIPRPTYAAWLEQEERDLDERMAMDALAATSGEQDAQPSYHA